MRIETKWSDAPVDLGAIGRTGENAARVIEFDCTDALADYPDASILCAIRHPCDSAAYLGSLTADGKKRMLTLTAAECAVKGRLHMELRVVDGDTVLKTATYTGWVEEALTGSADKPGNPVANVLNRLDGAVEKAETAASAAQTIAAQVQEKLDSGELQGPKGDPGKDAEVTAESVEAALGYKPAKVQADPTWGIINNSNGEIAINPASNSNIISRSSRQAITPGNIDFAVKVAMCDGKGAAWTASEQKVARERMGIPGEFELIEDITLSEDVMNVSREAFPEGTPYDLKSLIVAVDSIDVENRPTIDGWVRLNAKLQQSEWAYISPGRFVSAEDSLSFFVYRTSSDGSVDSYFVSAPNNMQTGTAVIRYYIPKNIIRFGKHINDFLLYSTGEAIPANTKITIYGVRA